MNEKLFVWINSFAGHSWILDEFGIFLAKFGVYVFVAVEIYLYFVKKRKNETVFAFWAMLLGITINQIIGLFYFHNRPFMDNLGVELIKHTAENSFPSDHTTFMLSLAFCLTLFKKTRIYGFFLIALGFLSGFARVFVGVHYPYDIIGGGAVGFVSAILIYIFKNKFQILNDTVFRTENKYLRLKSDRDS